MFAILLTAAVAAGGAGRELAVAPFHGIDLSARASLQVEQGPGYHLVASGDPQLVRCVTAEVRDGRLTIGWAGDRRSAARSQAVGDTIVVNARSGCRHRSSPDTLSIRVTAPAIDGVAIREQGVVSIAPMTVPRFEADITGRGSIAIDGLKAGDTRLTVPGIGRIVASGDLGRLGASIPGSGVVDARAAQARAIDVTLGGHGAIAASVDGPATGTLGGSGTIAIGGHPACTVRKLGKGRVICPMG